MGIISFKFLGECLLLLMIWNKLGNSQDFGYDGSKGPNYWGDKYTKCVGKHQSPIDIEATNVKTKKFPPLLFENFNEPLKSIYLENNGHTVVIKIKQGKIPKIDGGPLQAEYQFSQLHFHWGYNDTEGSENLINHHRFPLELHMVFFKSEYGDLENAMTFKDGLVVLSFLYSVARKENLEYNKFEQGLTSIHNLSMTTEIENFVSIDQFTTTNRNSYFSYEGSLTTPPCYEVVTWIEFTNTIPLSKEQIKAFRLLYSKEGQLTHNFRPVQPIHDRIIYLNLDSGHDSTRSSFMNVVMALFMALYRDSLS